MAHSRYHTLPHGASLDIKVDLFFLRALHQHPTLTSRHSKPFPVALFIQHSSCSSRPFASSPALSCLLPAQCSSAPALRCLGPRHGWSPELTHGLKLPRLYTPYSGEYSTLTAALQPALHLSLWPLGRSA